MLGIRSRQSPFLQIHTLPSVLDMLFPATPLCIHRNNPDPALIIRQNDKHLKLEHRLLIRLRAKMKCQ